MQGSTSEGIPFGPLDFRSKVPPNPTLGRGVTAVWPRQEASHADRAAHQQISHRWGAGNRAVCHTEAVTCGPHI